MVIIKSLKLALQNAQYTLWRWSRPDAAFKDYFASIVLKDIATGRKHPTLGGNLCEGRFGEAGEAAFHRLLQQGIAPDDICVDYGCGTLRIGVHAMRFLRPSGYWGLDINQALLDTGVHLIGSRLLEERKPNLRVISHASVKEAAQANPSFLFSIAVLIHIHPQELEEYFRNILLIVGKGGRGLISGRWSVGDTLQVSRQSWAHSLPGMMALVNRLGGRLSVLEAKRIAKHSRIKRGMLEIRMWPPLDNFGKK